MMHMLAPTWMVFAAGQGGYGDWQKGMILYFVGGVVLVDHLDSSFRRAGVRRRCSERIVVARKPAPAPASRPSG